MANTFERPVPVPLDRTGRDWPRRLYGVALLAFGGLALCGLGVGVASQVVPFSGYDHEVEAELNRPLILPCLVAVVTAGAGAVAWWLAFVRKSTPRVTPAPFVAVTILTLGAAFALGGPSEAELERRWADRLHTLQLPSSFAPVQPDVTLTNDVGVDVVCGRSRRRCSGAGCPRSSLPPRTRCSA